METPPVILVPPTPVRSNPSSPAHTSGSSDSDVARLSADNQERSSSDTATIVTIYSMYGDDPGARGSWSASASMEDTKPPLDRDPSPKPHHPYPNLLPESSRHSEPPYPIRTSSTRLGVSDPSRQSKTASSSGRFSHADLRPASTHAFPSLRERTGDAQDPRRSGSPSQRRRHSAAPNVILDSETIRKSLALQSPPPSRSSSSHKQLSESPQPNGHLSPSLRSSSSSSSNPSRPASSAQLHPPTPTTPPRKSLLRPAGSPGSVKSLAPSEGEDPDSFHVRSTYAQLDMHGVKGDGYTEGVERTRARVGVSRASEIRAEEAVDDGSEKRRELTAEEVQMLESLDRYGFFRMPSHERLVRLPALPLLRRLAPVSAGPAGAPAHAVPVADLPAASFPPQEARRIAKWGRMLAPAARDAGGNVAAWGVRPRKEHKLRARLYKGVPDRWRSAAWELLMARFARAGQAEGDRLAEDYHAALELPSEYDIQIDLDVPRTISGHFMFKTRYGTGQRSLFHVLHSFSLRCPQCGYVQGMGPIAATFLCYLEPPRVYAALVRLHDAYAMHAIFSPGFPGLLESIFVQERVVARAMPDVYAAFKRHMVSTTAYATKWYITLFSNSVPFQTQLRLWDVFLLEGQDLFVAVAVAIVWVYRDHITAGSANFETVLSLLSSFFVLEDENAFLAWIGNMLADKKLRADMTAWRAEWHQLVARGEDTTALL